MVVAGVIGKLSEGAVFLLFLPRLRADPLLAAPLPHLSPGACSQLQGTSGGGAQGG